MPCQDCFSFILLFRIGANEKSHKIPEKEAGQIRAIDVLWPFWGGIRSRIFSQIGLKGMGALFLLWILFNRDICCLPFKPFL